MGQPYLSARVITSRVKTTPSTTDNMRCFILLALIAAASASCVNRVRTTHQQPAVQRSHSSSSTSSSCFHAPQQIYRPQPAPVYAPCYAPCYGCTGTYVSASDSSSKTYSAEPAVYEETIVPCDDPVEADPVQITESKSSSTKSTSNATKEVTRTSTTHC